MQYDIFFSISQTPARGVFPTEAQMFRNFLDQVEAADRLGYGTAWIAESHLSSEVQKQNARPVIPHWQGEVGLNVDFLQTATRVFARTQRIGCGSAIMNILCNGGPVAAAERVAAFLAWHGLDPAERRPLHVGFAAGRFDFMNQAYGVGPRDPLERAAWGVLKGEVFARAAEIFLRLLRGDTVASDQIPELVLQRAQFRSDADWERVLAHAPSGSDRIEIPPFFQFEALKIVPQDFRRELLQLVVGSHDPGTQIAVNRILPVQVFNLSITRPDVIEATHERLRAHYHPDGGPWQRGHMPRTTFVFLNARPELSAEARRAAALEEARHALGAYWTALEGTLDPSRVEHAATNALIGDPTAIAAQIRERFHPGDRLMLWFDFFNHDSARVCADMADFHEQVVPLVEGR